MSTVASKREDPDYLSTLHACEKCGTLYVGNHGRYRCEAMRWVEARGVGMRCDGLIKPLSGAQSPTVGYLATRRVTEEFNQIPWALEPSSVIGRNVAGEVLGSGPGEPQNLPTAQPSPITQPIVAPDERVKP